MEYPYTKGSLDNPPKYFYSNPDIFDSWRESRDATCYLIKKDVDRLVKKFEIAKSHKIADLIAASDVFEAAYELFKNMAYLNILIKCIDVLCSVRDDLDMGQKMHLGKLISRERRRILFERGRA